MTRAQAREADVAAGEGPPGDGRSDEQLLAAYGAGDAAAFEALYLRYRDWAARLARRFCGRDDLALDVTQETFLYLIRKGPGLRLTARLTTFLYPVVKHLSADALRRTARLVSDDAALDGAAAPPETDASRSELAAALASLGEAHREVVLMRFVDDMSLAEIAAALRAPLGTVKSRLHNALETLRGDPRCREYFLGE